MKAKMKDGLCDIYKAVMPDEFDSEVEAFLDSIDGKEVELIFTDGDAFEKNDNNIWLPDYLWTAIK